MKWLLPVLVMLSMGCDPETIHEHYQMRMRFKNGTVVPWPADKTVHIPEDNEGAVFECSDDAWHWWPARADGTCSRADKPAVDESALSIAIFTAEGNCTPNNLQAVIHEVQRIERQK